MLREVMIEILVKILALFIFLTIVMLGLVYVLAWFKVLSILLSI
jgi:hypothetical protein